MSDNEHSVPVNDEPVASAPELVPVSEVAANKPEPTPPPRSLVEFLLGDAPAKRYLDALERFETPRPDEEQRAVALAAIEANRSLVGRVPDLMRVAVAAKTTSGTARSLTGFGAQVIRALVPDQERWGQLADQTPEALVDPLARYLRKARESKSKERMAQADALFLTGAIIAIARPDFNAAGFLQTIGAGLGTAPATPISLAHDVRRALLKAPVRAMQTLAQLRRLIGVDLDDARAQAASALAQSLEARERARAAADELRAAHQHAATLHSRIAELEARLAAADTRLDATAGGAANDQTRLRGSMRQLLRGRIAPLVEVALEALEAEPFAVPVARNRLQLIDAEVAKGMAWLDEQ